MSAVLAISARGREQLAKSVPRGHWHEGLDDDAIRAVLHRGLPCWRWEEADSYLFIDGERDVYCISAQGIRRALE